MAPVSTDLLASLRGFRKRPGFAIAVVSILALGIGMNAAIFSVVNAVMLRNLPYRDAGRLVSIWEFVEGAGPDNVDSTNRVFGTLGQPKGISVSAANLVTYRQSTPAVAEFASIEAGPMNFTGDGPPERLSGHKVSANLFPMLGISPVLGRSFLPEEDRPGSNFVVIIADSLWRRRFGADPGILGRTLMLDENAYRVIGVLPAGFQSPSEFGGSDRIDFYVPEALTSEELDLRSHHNITVIGRLAPGQSIERAQAQLNAIAAALGRQYPNSNRGLRAGIAPLRDDLIHNARLPLLVLLGAVGLTVLIACVNVANLYLVQAISRRREIGIRLALGARRFDIVRAFLMESFLFAMGGCVTGLALGWGLMHGLIALAPGNLPAIQTVSLDWRVFAVSAGLAAITALAFGLAPAWQTSRISPGEAIKTNDRTLSGKAQNRSRTVLIVAEISLATILTIGAGLLLKSFLTVLGVDLGFQPERVLAMRIVLPLAHYATPEERLRFFESLETSVGALPGVQSVTFANRMPLRGGWGGGAQVEGRDYGPLSVERQAVSPGYFETLGVPLQRGRFLTPGDRSGHPFVVVVSQAFARQVFGNEDPLGRRIRIGGGDPWMSIVGVVRDLHRDGKTAAIVPQVFIPSGQLELYAHRVQLGDFAVRAVGNPNQLVRAIRDKVFALDQDVPLTQVHTLEETITSSVAERRFELTLLAIFAGIALALAMTGIFGLLAHSVGQRTIELGIRMALGAPQVQVMGMVLKQAAVWTAAGLAFGVAGAFALSRYIESLLFQVKPHDWTAWAVAAVVLGLVSIGGAMIPARRAARVDPAVALRYE